MPKPKPVETSIVDLLQAGNAPQQVIDQLTPAAKRLTRGDLIALWLDEDDSTQDAVGIRGRGLGRLKKPQLDTADVNSILMAFDKTYALGFGHGPQPHGFFCGWSCCCCTPCCCCAVAVVKPVEELA